MKITRYREVRVACGNSVTTLPGEAVAGIEPLVVDGTVVVGTVVKLLDGKQVHAIGAAVVALVEPTSIEAPG